MKAILPPGYSNKGPGNMQSMMKQAQKLQEDMANLQADLDEREYSATVGGGAVTATVNGKHHVQKLDIRPDVVDPDDVEMLTDLVIAAVNEANRSAAATAEEELGAITGGMSIPGMF